MINETTEGEDVMPPWLWQRMLGWLLPGEMRDAALGDAAEELAKRARRDGERAARRWYRAQVLRSVAPAVGGWIGRFGRHDGSEPVGEGWTMWRNDLRLAWRVLWKRPGFTLTLALTLALGVGATTALFGVFRAVFLEPLDLPDPGELVVIMEQGSFGCCGPASGPDYVDWSQRQRSFDGLAVLSPRFFNVTSLDEAERVYGTLVSASAFDFLGVRPLLGRYVLRQDQVDPGVVVLSHGFWQRAFGGRPDVLDETVVIDGKSYAVVGVMPRGFDVPSPWGRTRSHELYIPFADNLLESDRGSHSYPVIARLGDDVDVEAAQADMDRVLRELGAEYPDTHADRSARIFTLHEYLFGDVGRQLGLILGAAGLVLLIACANVASLQLARAAAREGELAVRTALGASRRAVVRLLFSESLLLAAFGGVGGILVSMLAVDRLRAVLPPTIPRVDAIAIDGAALTFALAASVVTALVFGMVPALLAARTDLAAGVKEGGYATLAPVKERLRDAFIVGQIALGLVLANGAGLLVRSYANVRGQEYGFEADGTLTLALAPAGPEYETAADAQRYYELVADRLSEVPGVRGAGVVSKLPLLGGTNGNVQVEGRPPRASRNEGPLVEVSSVAGDYFAAMGIPLVAGRHLGPVDSIADAVGVIVNRRMTEEVWPGEDPIGKRFGFDDGPPWLTVVGVVGDVRQWGVEQNVIPEAYLPYSRGWSGSGYVVVHGVGDPAEIVSAVRAAIREIDPSQPMSEVVSMSERMESAFAQRRFFTTLMSVFATAALLLAFAGIYGTVSYFVARRTRELGIRIALGAGGPGILGLVVRRGIRLTVWGVGIGLVGVWATTSTASSLVYGIGAVDPLTLAGGCLALTLAAVTASALPATRAARLPPVLALRAE